MGTIWVTCLDIFRDLQIEIAGSSKDEPTTWWIKGKTRKGKELKLTLSMVSEDITKVGIRVGMFGDKILAEKIHDTITRQLESYR